MGEKREKFSWRIFLRYLPVVLFIAVVPLVTYLKVRELPDYVSMNFTGQQFVPDVSSYYRMIAVLVCAVFAIIAGIINGTKGVFRLKINFVTITILVYWILALISAIMSEFTYVAVWGMPESMEGILVITSYIVIFLYTYSVIDDLHSLKHIFVPFMVSIGIISFIGFLQFIGYDIFSQGFIRDLLNISVSPTNPFTISFVSSGSRTYSTLYNPNYFAHYLTLAVPAVIAAYAIHKNSLTKVVLIIVSYFCLISLIGSLSSGSFFAMGISVIIMVVLSGRYIKNNINSTVVYVTTLLSLILITNILMDGSVFGGLKAIFADTSQLNTIDVSPHIFFDDIVLSDDSFTVYTDDKDFTVINNKNTLVAFDINGKELALEFNDLKNESRIIGVTYSFKSSDYSNYKLATNEDSSIIALEAGNKKVLFYMTENGVMVKGINDRLQKITHVDRNEFLYTSTSLFGARGYYWSVALPQLKNSIFIGYGPDTSFVTLPQEDFIGKLNRVGTNLAFGGPHNMYIKYAHDTGIVSLICLLLVFSYYIYSTARKWMREKIYGIWRIYSISVLCGIVGFLIGGFFYDSIIFTAPVFWVLLAIGFALNKDVLHKDPEMV